MTSFRRSRVRPLQSTFILYPAPMGAITQLWGGTAPAAAEFNGKVCLHRARLSGEF
jgi:retinol dehydrogenase-12